MPKQSFRDLATVLDSWDRPSSLSPPVEEVRLGDEGPVRLIDAIGRE